MIVKQLEDIVGTEHDVDTATWRSCRLLVKKDGMGFSSSYRYQGRDRNLYLVQEPCGSGLLCAG